MHTDIDHLEYYNRAINIVKRCLDPSSCLSTQVFPHAFTQGHKHMRVISCTPSD